NSLSFKSNGYAISGSTLTMAGSFVTSDSGVTGTINSIIAGTAGLTKAGSGTVVLTNSNTYSGGTVVIGGALRVSSDVNLGAVPGSLTQDITLNGGTLQFGATFDINNNRSINVGPAGGTIDTNGFGNNAGYTQNNGIQGPG